MPSSATVTMRGSAHRSRSHSGLMAPARTRYVIWSCLQESDSRQHIQRISLSTKKSHMPWEEYKLQWSDKHLQKHQQMAMSSMRGNAARQVGKSAFFHVPACLRTHTMIIGSANQ